jgi:hypothetical protein
VHAQHRGSLLRLFCWANCCVSPKGDTGSDGGDGGSSNGTGSGVGGVSVRSGACNGTESEGSDIGRHVIASESCNKWGCDRITHSETDEVNLGDDSELKVEATAAKLQSLVNV